MIREILLEEYPMVKEFAMQDIARNYFILLGLESKKSVYRKLYGEYEGNELKAVLFQRNSGVLQFYGPGEFDVDGFAEIILSMEYDILIGPKSYCEKFLVTGVFSFGKEGAYISKLEKDYEIEPRSLKYTIKEVGLENLDQIVNLYKEVFQSFSPKEVMEQKLRNNRGRGLYIEENKKIISVAQTDFETEDGAIIVGVATDNDYRNRGLATECLYTLCDELLKEKKDLYLQYDNLEAGRIYEKLGFRIMDQVIHYKRGLKGGSNEDL